MLWWTVKGNADLLEVVDALGAHRPPRAVFWMAGKEQANQDGDDGDHHQKFDQREEPGVWEKNAS